MKLVARRRPRLADNDLGQHLLVGLLESRAGKRRDHLCDRLLGKLVEPEPSDIRPGPATDQGDLRPLALDDPEGGVQRDRVPDDLDRLLEAVTRTRELRASV